MQPCCLRTATDMARVAQWQRGEWKGCCPLLPNNPHVDLRHSGFKQCYRAVRSLN